MYLDALASLVLFIQSEVWPKTAQIGIYWCIAGVPLTVVGGLTCSPTTENSTAVNTCYYDVDGDKADLYRTMSVLLIVLHVFSFLFFTLTCCPLKTIKNKIVEDPKPASAKKAQPAKKADATKTSETPKNTQEPNTDAKSATNSATNSATSIPNANQSGTIKTEAVGVGCAQSSAPISTDEKADENKPGVSTTKSSAQFINVAALESIISSREKAVELELKMQHLAEREEELKRREDALRRYQTNSDWQSGIYPPPLPPSYNVVVDLETTPENDPLDVSNQEKLEEKASKV